MLLSPWTVGVAVTMTVTWPWPACPHHDRGYGAHGHCEMKSVGNMTVANLPEMCLGPWEATSAVCFLLDFLLIEPGSLLSESTAVCWCEGVLI